MDARGNKLLLGQDVDLPVLRAKYGNDVGLSKVRASKDAAAVRVRAAVSDDVTVQSARLHLHTKNPLAVICQQTGS
jgi:hypothetical protein